MSTRRVVLASSNAGKLREFSELLAASGLELVRQSDFQIAAPPETGVTFLENALIKARNAAGIARLPAIADDSGIEVDALGGAPGVYSARYASLNGGEKSDAANNARLVKDLANESDRRAYFFSVLVLVRRAADPEPLIAEGRWHGEVIDTPRGANGFGYDAHFLVPSLGKTAAELDPAVKNASSHRAIALRHLLARLKDVS